MITATDAESLIARFERRNALLDEMRALARRQRRCIEQGRTGRLDRLIRHREHALLQWRQVEDELGRALQAARGGTLPAKYKARLRTLLAESDNLVEAIVREDDLAGEAIGAARNQVAGELEEIRKGQAVLRAYAGKPAAAKHVNVDRSA